jgi:hypothetical protein
MKLFARIRRALSPLSVVVRRTAPAPAGLAYGRARLTGWRRWLRRVQAAHPGRTWCDRWPLSLLKAATGVVIGVVELHRVLRSRKTLR